ncbi:hypothetical protein GCM10009741_58530 [Kribbella lupini]|uniref:Uncharacterized protein n=1 Tax=Kribbella lupini TaxID=291602 RepID=A0ABP4MQI7_9ACTN
MRIYEVGNTVPVCAADPRTWSDASPGYPPCSDAAESQYLQMQYSDEPTQTLEANPGVP